MNVKKLGLLSRETIFYWSNSKYSFFISLSCYWTDVTCPLVLYFFSVFNKDRSRNWSKTDPETGRHWLISRESEIGYE
jgi:hypothetical protein